MKYSDSIYLSRFAIDPDSEFVGADLIEDFKFLDTPDTESLDDELLPDPDTDVGFM